MSNFSFQTKKSTLSLEGLEERQVPTCGATLNSAGILRIDGSRDNDFIKIESTEPKSGEDDNKGEGEKGDNGKSGENKHYTVKVTLHSDHGINITKEFDATKVKSIQVYGNGGKDSYDNGTKYEAKASNTKDGAFVNLSKKGDDDLKNGGKSNEDFSKALGTGTFKADNKGLVQIDFMYDGGGYVGEMGIYSLKGMTAYKPGSAEYIQEAARRVLSSSTLGYVAIRDITDGAKHSEKLKTDGAFNNGTYQGVQTFKMNANQEFGIVLIPNGTFWEAYSNPNSTGAKRALFSNANANPTQSVNGGHQLADITGEHNVFGWEDQRLDANSDKDYNDIIFRLIGAETDAVNYKSVAAAGKSILKDPSYPTIIA